MPPRTPDSPQSLAEQTHRLLREQDWDKAYDVFGRLHDLLHPQLMGKAKRKMRSEEAEDIVEEALLSLYQHLSTKECPENVEAWSGDVVTKRIADHYRLRRNTEELLAPPIFWEGHANRQKAQRGVGSNPLTAAIKKEEQRQVNVLLDDLPEDVRSVVEAHYYDELPWAEVAAQLNLTIDVAKKRSKTALSMMSKMAVKRGFKHDH